jgi:hypothetical protein
LEDKIMSGWRDSNPQSPAPKAGALAKLGHIQETRRPRTTRYYTITTGGT